MNERINNKHQAYPASNFDKALRWTEQLPVSVWLIYLVLLILLIVFSNALAWITGSLPVGTFDLYRSSIPFYPIGSLVLIEYLNRVALRSLNTFRPALEINDEEYDLIAYRLVTMPRWGIRITVLISIVGTVIYFLYTPYLLELIQEWPIVALIECVFYIFVFGIMGIFFYHTIWQLRMVSQIHAMITRVDLFNRIPLYAFSRLSAQTGIGLLLMNYFGIATDPATFSNIALINVTVIALILAIVCFLLPLHGVYRRIVAEKRRLLAMTNRQLSTLVQQMYAVGNEQSMDDLTKDAQVLNSIVTTHRMIERIPTLPWEMGTLIGFLSAVIAPLIAGELISLLASYLVT